MCEECAADDLVTDRMTPEEAIMLLKAWVSEEKVRLETGRPVPPN